MREIKFRVWDIDRKEWLKNTGNPYIFPFDGRVAMKCAGDSTGHIDKQDYSEEYELEQFTGLRDKKGKEIYEGDIVRFGPYKANTETIQVPIEFHEGSFVMMREGLGYLINTRVVGEAAEVIGNIHETPELL